MPDRDIFKSEERWSQERPRTLVVACSDGRLQKSIDDFLEHTMGVTDYDRLYAPGGPGALAATGFEIMRADQFRREFAFLMKAHGTEEVILLFHSASAEGPEESICAHYRRLMPRASRMDVALQQEEDAREVLRQAFVGLPEVTVHVYRAEVFPDSSVHFVDMLRRGIDKKSGEI